MATNKEIAERVLRAVGGKENILQATHCMTPLIPLLFVSGLLKMVPALFGQGVLNLLSPVTECQQ